MKKHLVAFILFWTINSFSQKEYNQYYSDSFEQIKESKKLEGYCEKLQVENSLYINNFNVSICMHSDFFEKLGIDSLQYDCKLSNLKKDKSYRNGALKKLNKNKKSPLELTLTEVKKNYFIGKVSHKITDKYYLLFLFKIENGRATLIDSMNVVVIE
jgi:hypothetical protein